MEVLVAMSNQYLVSTSSLSHGNILMPSLLETHTHNECRKKDIHLGLMGKLKRGLWINAWKKIKA